MRRGGGGLPVARGEKSIPRKRPFEFPILRRDGVGFTLRLGRVDELFDDNPRGHKMNECEKGLAQFLIPRGNASKLFEFVKKPFYLLA